MQVHLGIVYFLASHGSLFMPLMGLYSLGCWLIDEWESCFNTLNGLALGATAGALGATLGATAGHHSNTRKFFYE